MNKRRILTLGIGLCVVGFLSTVSPIQAAMNDWIVNGGISAAGTAGDDIIVTDPAGGSAFTTINTGAGKDQVTVGVGTVVDVPTSSDGITFDGAGADVANIFGSIVTNNNFEFGVDQESADLLTVNIASTGSITGIFAANNSVGVHNNLGDTVLNNAGFITGTDFGVLTDVGSITLDNSGVINTVHQAVQSALDSNILNSGIMTSVTGEVINVGDDLVLHNTFTGTIIAQDGSAMVVTTSANVQNDGLISATSDVLSGNDNIFIHNTSTGTWTANGFGADGVEANDNVTVVNDGTWAVNGTGADGVDVGDNATVINNGTWTAFGANFDNAVDAFDNLFVLNTGTMTSQGTVVAANLDATIINTGVMTSTARDVISAFNATVENYGDMLAPMGSGIVVNGGGLLSYYGGPGSRLESFDDALAGSNNNDVIVVDNATVVSTNGNSMSLFAGDDSVDIIGHSRVQGLMNGGANTDTLHFALFGLCSDTEKDLQAIADLAGPGLGTFTYWGNTYSWVNFENVDVDGFKFENWGQTPNQKAIASTFDCIHNIDVAVGPDQKVIDFLDDLYAVGKDGFPDVLNLLSPQRYEVLSEIAFDNNDFLIQHMNNRSENLREGASSWQGSGVSIADGSQDSRMTRTKQGLASTRSSRARQSRGNDEKFGMFLEGNAVMGDHDGNRDIQDYSWDTVSIVGGFDYKVMDTFAIGLMGGYSNTDADLDDRGSDANIDTYTFGLYANWWWQHFYVNGLFTYAFNQYEGDRVAFYDTKHFDTDGDQFSFALSGGYDWQWGNLSMGPIAGLRYTHWSMDSFKESGDRIDTLWVDSEDADSLRTSIGAKATYDFHCGSGCVITPELRASWGHEFVNDQRTITGRFNTDQLDAFHIKTSNPERDWAELGASVRARLNDRWSVFVDYDTHVGFEDSFAQSVQGGVRFEF